MDNSKSVCVARVVYCMSRGVTTRQWCCCCGIVESRGFALRFAASVIFGTYGGQTLALVSGNGVVLVWIGPCGENFATFFGGRSV